MAFQWSVVNAAGVLGPPNLSFVGSRPPNTSLGLFYYFPLSKSYRALIVASRETMTVKTIEMSLTFWSLVSAVLDNQ